MAMLIVAVACFGPVHWIASFSLHVQHAAHPLCIGVCHACVHMERLFGAAPLEVRQVVDHPSKGSCFGLRRQSDSGAHVGAHVFVVRTTLHEAVPQLSSLLVQCLCGTVSDWVVVRVMFKGLRCLVMMMSAIDERISVTHTRFIRKQHD